MLNVSQDYNKFILENFQGNFKRIELEKEIRRQNKGKTSNFVSRSNEIDYLFNLEYLFREKDIKLIKYITHVFKKDGDLENFIKYFRKIKDIKIIRFIKEIGIEEGVQGLINSLSLILNVDLQNLGNIDYESDSIFLRKQGEIIPINDFQESYFEEAENMYKVLGEEFIIDGFKLTKNEDDTDSTLDLKFSSSNYCYFPRECFRKNKNDSVIINKEKIKFINFNRIYSPKPNLDFERFTVEGTGQILCINTDEGINYIETSRENYWTILNIRKQYIRYLYEDKSFGFMEVYRMNDADIDDIIDEDNIFSRGHITGSESEFIGVIRYDNSDGYPCTFSISEGGVKQIRSLCKERNVSCCIRKAELWKQYNLLVECIRMLNLLPDNFKVNLIGREIKRDNNLLKLKLDYYEAKELSYYVRINNKIFGFDFTAYWDNIKIGFNEFENIHRLLEDYTKICFSLIPLDQIDDVVKRKHIAEEILELLENNKYSIL